LMAAFQRAHGISFVQGQSLTRGRLRRAQQGLYHGRQKQHGDHISYSHLRTKRVWKPNVHWKSFRSELLGHSFQVPVTAKALRCIDKKGGIDNYILFTKESDIDSEIGMELKKYLVAAWEKKNNTKYNRRKILLEARIAALAREQELNRPILAAKGVVAEL